MNKRASFEDLPSPLDEIAEVAGLAAALAIADAVGGTRVSIPARPADDHWLVELLGHEQASAIARHFMTLSPEDRTRGARHIVIPRGPAGLLKKAKARFYADRDKGMSVRCAARRAQVHERTAFRWEARRGTPDDTDQLFLFNSPVEGKG